MEKLEHMKNSLDKAEKNCKMCTFTNSKVLFVTQNRLLWNQTFYDSISKDFKKTYSL